MSQRTLSSILNEANKRFNPPSAALAHHIYMWMQGELIDNGYDLAAATDWYASAEELCNRNNYWRVYANGMEVAGGDEVFCQAAADKWAKEEDEWGIPLRVEVVGFKDHGNESEQSQ